jgi:hypothetical protein
MDHGHWVPPNRGVTNLVTSLNYGMGSGTHSGTAATVAPTNGTSVKRGSTQSAEPATGSTAHRSSRAASSGERYGPAGVVQVARHYHGPGCPDCSGGRSIHTVRSAFGSQDGFSQGSSAGK